MFTAMKQLVDHYRERGYARMKVFPGEYVLMFNWETGGKVRIYFNGHFYEYK